MRKTALFLALFLAAVVPTLRADGVRRVAKRPFDPDVDLPTVPPPARPAGQ